MYFSSKTQFSFPDRFLETQNVKKGFFPNKTMMYKLIYIMSSPTQHFQKPFLFFTMHLVKLHLEY